MNQLSSHVIKMASKKASLSETGRFIKLWHEEKKVFGTFCRITIISGKKRKKSVRRMSEKLEMTNN